MEFASTMVLRMRSTPGLELLISAMIWESPVWFLLPGCRSERVLKGGGTEASATVVFPPMHQPIITATAKAQTHSGKNSALDRVGFIF